MHKPFVVGHRGAAGLEPENTLRSIARAIDVGVDAVEVDVRRTKDGELVVIHDPTVNRTTNGKGRVNSFTLKDLRALDAGKGERVPTFRELCAAVKGKVELFVEIKEPEIVREMVTQIGVDELAAKTTFVSFFHSALVSAKQLSPASRCGVIFSGDPMDPAKLALDVNADLIVPNQAYMSERMVKEAHKRSLTVQAWTVNSADDLRRVVGFGVDGVASDLPNLIVDALR
ncbi:MAG: glycerophosphodiester phosphodiesterase [Nitrososphaerota archaeon]|nr:glycerophosphodiester phosphodiesterase [Nitrososphaerota archaeon]